MSGPEQEPCARKGEESELGAERWSDMRDKDEVRNDMARGDGRSGAVLVVTGMRLAG